MLITRTSILSNKTRTRDINLTQDQLDAWESGVLAQNAFPHLSADDREFIMTGITSDEWDAAFKEDE